MSNLSPLAQQLYGQLKKQGNTWAGSEKALALLGGLSYPLDRAIISELLDAGLIQFRNVGPTLWWLTIHPESEAVK